MRRWGWKGCLLQAVIMCAVWSISASAYENEPKEFRGIEWGAPLESLSDMSLMLDGGALKAFVRKGDAMTLGQATLDRIHYVFYRGRFYCVYIGFTGLSNFKKVKESLMDLYGPIDEKESSGKNYFWEGQTASVTLNYSESTQTGEVGYKYMPLDAQIALDEKGRTE